MKPGPLLANWQVALGDPTSGASTLGPEGVGAAGNPCGFNGSGQPWVAAALANFFRPSGLNPALGQALLLSPAAGCVGLAQQIIAADGLSAACDPTTLSGCVPFSDTPANFSNGSSVYHGLTANLRKRFGQHYEFLGLLYLVAYH